MKVSVICGSVSDADVVGKCLDALDRLGLPHESKVLSAHRTPEALVAHLSGLEDRGVGVVICAAGMAAHLAGVVAAHTRLPVIGVPIAAGPLAGVDALLSTAQMPGGVPVATVGIGSAGAKNAAYLAARILALGSPEVKARLEAVLAEDQKKVLDSELPAR